MKSFKQMVLVLLLLLCFIQLCFGASAVKVFDTDGRPQGLKIEDGRIGLGSSGETVKTWWDPKATDGLMNEILIPEGTECRVVFLQVISSSNSDFDNNLGFHYSTTGGQGEDFAKFVGGVVISVRKESGSLGFIRAATGSRVAILVLY